MADQTALWIKAGQGLDQLFAALDRRGYAARAMIERDGCMTLGPVERVDDLPRGRAMMTDGGRVETGASGNRHFFDKALPMQGLKPLVYPAHETISHVSADFAVSIPEPDIKKLAVIGARACDLAALSVLDKVFVDGPYRDDRYAARRDDLLLIAVDCAIPLETCFCASMETGPHARAGFDLALSELESDGEHGFLVRIGSDAGAAIAAELDAEKATPEHLALKDCQADIAAAAMTRSMPADAETVVKASHDSPHWAEVANRCLTCANCTMVCPTCFCSTVEDRNALDGTAWRERRWDSCFSIDFSYIHGGAVRESPSSRYRQWMTHKLGHWHDQFDTSGCVGCGRCIAWCPVGIDITAEAWALARADASPTEAPQTTSAGAG